MVALDECGQRHVLINPRDTFHSLLRLGRNVASRSTEGSWAVGKAPEVPFDKRFRGGRIEISDNHENGIIRHIVFVIERLNVCNAGAIQVLHAADGHVPVGMNRVGMLIQRFDHGAIRLIIKTLAALLFHHFPFILEHLVCDLEIAHPVCLKP